LTATVALRVHERPPSTSLRPVTITINVLMVILRSLD